MAGLHGVDVADAGADSWDGRYLVFAESPDEARTRVRDAGFRRRWVRQWWSPTHEPREDLPDGPGPDDRSWYRRRSDDADPTPWERLPPDYRHPSPSRAAADPSLR